MLLSHAPRGADAVVELDLARLRANEVVGALATRVTRAGVGGTLAGGDLGAIAGELDAAAGAVLGALDAAVLCAYDLGTDDAATLTLVRATDDAARALAAGPGARALGDRVVALGPPALLDRVDAVAAGADALASDRALMAIRADAMPPKATGAVIRVAARLGFDARVGLAAQLELDEVPRAISLWGDVADDLAVVAVLRGGDEAEARALATGAIRARDRAARAAPTRSLGLQFAVAGIRIAERARRVRAVLVISPARLRALSRRVDRALGSLRAPAPDRARLRHGRADCTNLGRAGCTNLGRAGCTNLGRARGAL